MMTHTASAARADQRAALHHPPGQDSVCAHLDPEPRATGSARRPRTACCCFADTGWDQDEKWSPSVLDKLESFHAFLPNSVARLTGLHPITRRTPHDALHALAEARAGSRWSPAAGQGAIAIDLHHQRAGVGSGAAGQRPRSDRSRGCLRSRLRARHPGRVARPCGSGSRSPTSAPRFRFSTSADSLAAPGWGDIIDWLGRTRAKAADGSAHAAELAKGYEFHHRCPAPESGRISVRPPPGRPSPRISDADDTTGCRG